MSEPKSEYKVEVKNLTKYFGDLHVLNDISFNVRKGEFICIVGPTGCGKTTFLNLLTRIYMPSKGDLLIDGESADPKKHNLAFVFQEPSSIPWKTVEENLRWGDENASPEQVREGYRKEAERQLRAMLAVRAIAEAEKITVTQQEVDAEIARLSKLHDTPEEEIRKVLSRDAIAAAVTNQKVQRFLLDHAALTSVVEKE